MENWMRKKQRAREKWSNAYTGSTQTETGVSTISYKVHEWLMFSLASCYGDANFFPNYSLRSQLLITSIYIFSLLFIRHLFQSTSVYALYFFGSLRRNVPFARAKPVAHTMDVCIPERFISFLLRCSIATHFRRIVQGGTRKAKKLEDRNQKRGRKWMKKEQSWGKVRESVRMGEKYASKW